MMEILVQDVRIEQHLEVHLGQVEPTANDGVRVAGAVCGSGSSDQ